MSKDKKKKQKPVYVDDGRTIADMSHLYGGKSQNGYGNTTRGTFKDHMNTYFAAVKMMFWPMIVTIIGICIVFAIIYLVFSFAS